MILPGVGAFPKAMDVLEERDLVCVLKEVCDIGKPPRYMFGHAAFI